jgi:hypothetical protein
MQKLFQRRVVNGKWRVGFVNFFPLAIAHQALTLFSTAFLLLHQITFYLKRWKIHESKQGSVLSICQHDLSTNSGYLAGGILAREKYFRRLAFNFQTI